MAMSKRERVMSAIRHIQPDRLPCGELAIDPVTADRLLGGGYSLESQDFERETAVRKLLGMDFINIGDWPTWQIGTNADGSPLMTNPYGDQFVMVGGAKKIINKPFEDLDDIENYPVPDISRVTGNIVEKFAKTDLFVFAQIGGPISMLNEMMGMEDYLIAAMTETDRIALLAEKVMEFEVAKAKLFLDKGADAILIADDMAFNTGLLLPPDVMEEAAFPFYKSMIAEIKKHRDVPVFLHSDGDMNEILGRIVELGFDGLHSLQPTANMDIEKIKKEYGSKLCLIGNIDLNYVLTFGTEDEVEANVAETIEKAYYDGGYMLSSCNCLISDIPDKNIFAMYRKAKEY